MANYCTICGKKIGFWGHLESRKKSDGIVCGECDKKVSQILELYYRKNEDYSIVLLKKCAEKWESLKHHFEEVDKIKREYQNEIDFVQIDINEHENMRREEKNKMRQLEVDYGKANLSFIFSGLKTDYDCKKLENQAKNMEIRKANNAKTVANHMKSNVIVNFAKEQDFYDKYHTYSKYIIEALNIHINGALKKVETLKLLCKCDVFTYLKLNLPEEIDILGEIINYENNILEDERRVVTEIRRLISCIYREEEQQIFENDELSKKGYAKFYYYYKSILRDEVYDLQDIKLKIEEQKYLLKSSELMDTKLYEEDKKRYDQYLESQNNINQAFIESLNKLKQIPFSEYVVEDISNNKNQDGIEKQHEENELLIVENHNVNIQDVKDVQKDIPTIVGEDIKEDTSVKKYEEKQKQIDTMMHVQEKMKVCMICKYQNKENAKFCVNCGSSLSCIKFCSQCGHKIRPNKMFCANCGARIEN